MKERRSYQNELSKRASSDLPFVDKHAVKDATKTIRDSMDQIGSRKGKVIYPYELSRQEQEIVRQRLGISLGKRITFEPIVLKEGMGTQILIAKKNKGGEKYEHRTCRTP